MLANQIQSSSSTFVYRLLASVNMPSNFRLMFPSNYHQPFCDIKMLTTVVLCGHVYFWIFQSFGFNFIGSVFFMYGWESVWWLQLYVENLVMVQIIKNEDLEELRELGSGTFGTVYHGKWRGTDVAIKRIKKSCFTGRSSEQERLVFYFLLNYFWCRVEPSSIPVLLAGLQMMP